MYRLYVDEVGTDALTHLEKDKHRFLSLTGVVMEIEHAGSALEPNMNWIKTNVLKHDPDHPIILHRKEIMGYKGHFQCLRDPDTCSYFDRAVLRLFQSAEYAVITALIDKQWMVKQEHWQLTHPYHYLMDILVEKYAQFLERKSAIGDIMPESREGKDGLLQAAYARTMDKGTYFVSAKRMEAVIRAQNLKFRKKRDNIAGLQLCDLLAHPSHIYTRQLMRHEVSLGPFATQVADILVGSKYDRSKTGKISGYGIKHLPQ